MKKKIHEYQATGIRSIVQIVARMVQQRPDMADNMDYLWANLCVSIPSLKEKDKCGGCGRNMKITIYEADLHDALLILAMAREVKENLKKGLTFTEANKVHMPTLPVTNGILKRQTKCDYLGLIKQPENWRGSGYWLLTHWAYKALRGEEIPKAVKYWEGQLLARSKANITLLAMFQNHTELVKRALEKRKAIKADYRAVYNGYDPKDWRIETGEVVG